MSRLPIEGRLNVGALVAAALGILVIFVSAPDRFPTVPPGPIILLTAGTAVAFLPGRWTPVIGVLVPVFLLVGGLASGELVDAISDPENAGVVIGLAIQVVAAMAAIVAGVAWLRQRETGKDKQ